MDQNVEENELKMHRSIITAPDWLDLPEPIVTNIILEHLELVDYIRFSAVCKNWESTQKKHRSRYSPHPPPLPLTFPWLRCRRHKQKTICLYQPDKQKSFNISLPRHRINPFFYTMALGHGWLLLLYTTRGFHRSMLIFNPITRVQIDVPIYLHGEVYTAYISSPPSDPHCTIFIQDHRKIFYLCQLNDRNSLKLVEYSDEKVGRTILCHNKMYNVMRGEIIVFDTLPHNSDARLIKMDCSDICTDMFSEMFEVMDFLGDLVMVVIEYEIEDADTINKFHVYKADFSKNKWVRMETLGDHALFYSEDILFSLPAIDVGYKKNTIYSTDGFEDVEIAWRAFDLSTKDWIDGPSMSIPNHYFCWSWFLPTLNYPDDAQINGA